MSSTDVTGTEHGEADEAGEAGSTQSSRETEAGRRPRHRRPRSVGLLRASAVMASGTLTSRVLGLVSKMLLSAALGLTAADLAANAFDVANKLPNTIYLLVAGGALNAVLVPTIVRADSDGKRGKEFLDRLLTLALVGMLALTIVLTLAAEPLVRLYSEGWSDPQVTLAVAFAYWCIPQVFFYGAYTFLGQLLNARRSFGPYTWAPVANNVVAIIGLIAFIALFDDARSRPLEAWTPQMVAVLAGSATLGVVAQAAVLAWPLRLAGFTWRPRWGGWRGMGFRTAGRVAAWTFGAVAANQIAFLVVSRTASSTTGLESASADTTASSSAWTYAFLIVMLPHSLVAVSLVTAVFPRLASASTAGDLQRLRGSVSATLRVLAVGMTLPAAALVAFGPEVARVLLPGAQSGEQAATVGIVAAAIAVGIPAFSSSHLLHRFFYAQNDGRPPFTVQASIAGLWILLILVVRLVVEQQHWVIGVAVTMSIVQILGFVGGLTWAQRRVGGVGVRGVLWVHARVIVLAAVLVPLARLIAQAAGGSSDTVGEAIIALVVGGIVLLVGYVGGCLLLRVREIREAAAPVLRRLGRR